MAAELAHVHGRARRWRFTAGLLRVVLFPPARHPIRVAVVACAGLMATVAVTAAAAREVPTMSVFAAALGLLLCGYATVMTSRSQRPRPTAPRVIVGAAALAGVAAAVAAVIRIAVAYPAATTDRTHVFSVLFALALTGYLAVALGPFGPGDRTGTALWWALGGAVASGAAWTAAAVATTAATTGSAAFAYPGVAALTLAVSAGAAATTRSARAGAWAGLLAVILGALANFTATLTAMLQLHHYILGADAAAYAHSGYPSVASYILSDALGGGILSDLVVYPVVLLGVALLGAVAGRAARARAAGRSGVTHLR
jgi:hypothetical protein